MNDRTVDILRILLTSEDYRSGADICAGLGISRTAVWKHVQLLREQGYSIDSVPNRGYRLRETPEAPTAAGIEAARQGRRLGSRVIWRESTESTNRLATELAESGAQDGSLVIAETQTGGRGRLARNWHSAAGQSLTLSIILRPRIAPLRVPQLSLVSAVACAAAIERECGIQVQVKWPNDLYIAGRKTAGILCDLHAEMDRLHFLVLGIGINVAVPAESFPPDCRDRATSLATESGRPVNRARLVLRLLDELEEACDRWIEDGLAPFLDAWRGRSLFRGQRVRVDSGMSTTLHGTVRDLQEDGALLLETDDGRLRPLYSGDVSLHGNPVPPAHRPEESPHA